MNEQSQNWKQVNKRNTANLAIWTLAWTLTMAVVSFGPKFIWGNDATLSLIAILINTAIGVGMILANKRHLNGLDELYRKVQLESMALALGVAVVGGLSYSMLDAADVISFDAEISHLVILIGLTYLVSTVIGLTRYK
ncbi:hypothetical protein [Marinoscillum sp.]|uniref:hypothetical protein n=1 Tax=Marinoscillum sp. TaxID=2024838 RepID=UPI003BA8CA85